MSNPSKMRSLAVLLALLSIGSAVRAQEKPPGDPGVDVRDRMGGLPPGVVDRQSRDRIDPPPVAEAVATALAAAREVSRPLLVPAEGRTGRAVRVPEDFPSIQEAVDAAEAGDVVRVRAGTYFEQIVMKDGVRLVSDASDGGDEPVEIDGVHLKLPRRALRTIIDGSRATASPRGMIDFDPGIGRPTLVDGFTIRNLPRTDHHVPGHAHGINIRGASPVITNCLIRDNGSTGIGNHVVYRSPPDPAAGRDFRRANVAHGSSAVIYHNVIRGSLGLGIGCNDFSTPFILGNEVLENDDSPLGGTPGPGIGGKHGSAATIVGNIVHDNPGGGILCRKGSARGAHPVDGPTHPVIDRNVVLRNGEDRPGIAAHDAGSREEPVRIVGNFVYGSGSAGIALSGGSVGIVERNTVAGGRLAGVAIRGSIALKLNGNRVTGSREAPGFVIVAGSEVDEMIGNAAHDHRGPRFLLRESRVREGRPAGKGSTP